MAEADRVGILTFHNTVNYGGVLQALALQQVVTSLGFTPLVIDYHGGAAASRSGTRLKRLVRPGVYLINDLLGAALRRQRTADFRDQFFATKTRSYHQARELHDDPPVVSALIVGSDQVWNPEIIGRDSSYFLDFAGQGTVRIAYAASIGLNRLPADCGPMWRKGISSLHHVSVREPDASTIVRELTGREAPVVLDPTLLLPLTFWDSIAGSSVSKGHVLSYTLPGDRGAERVVRQISMAASSATHLPWIRVGDREVRRLIEPSKSPRGVGPKEFLSLLMGASYVVTNSFHGTALAISAGVPFTAVVPKPSGGAIPRSGRVVSLLKSLGLADRLVAVGDVRPAGQLVWAGRGDVLEAHGPLNRLRVESTKWLARALEDSARHSVTSG